MANDLKNEVCDSLPSAGAAGKLVRGEPGGIPEVLVSVAGRAALIAAGLAAVGMRKGLVTNSLAGAAAIEVFVIGYAWKNAQSTHPPVPQNPEPDQSSHPPVPQNPPSDQSSHPPVPQNPPQLQRYVPPKRIA